MSLFSITPSKTKAAIIECMLAGLVPLVTSSPGMGKSAIIAQIAEEHRLKVIDLRLSQCAPEDLMGLPMRLNNGKATFAPFEMFPTSDTSIPDGYVGWILFLDEFTTASKSVQAASYKIVLDKMVGQAKLHDNVYIVCAGNLMTDRAIVTQMSTAMQSRLVHIEMAVDHQEFVQYAVKTGMDSRILGFLEFQPGKLHAFQPDHQDKTFACPRTWEFASRLIKGKTFEQINLPLLAGTLSDGVAVEFHTFLSEYAQIPTFAAIEKDPETTDLPEQSSTSYAIVSMVLDRITVVNFEDVSKYVKRMAPELQAVYFRGVLNRYPELKRTPIFANNIEHLTRFLNDDEYNLAA